MYMYIHTPCHNSPLPVKQPRQLYLRMVLASDTPKDHGMPYAHLTLTESMYGWMVEHTGSAKDAAILRQSIGKIIYITVSSELLTDRQIDLRNHLVEYLNLGVSYKEALRILSESSGTLIVSDTDVMNANLN